MKYNWEVIRDGSGDISVVPIDDKREHDAFCDKCKCEPSVEVIGSCLLYIHSAFDFREVAEELDRRE